MGLLNIPSPTKEKGQRSLSAEDAYFTRFIPSWTFPSGLSPDQWRHFVRMQPVAVNFRDTLIMTIQSLDWKITPRDSDMRDELKNSVRYHTQLLEHGGQYQGLDWTAMIEWLLTDLLDLPFGTAVEVGRTNDSPSGRVVWFKPLDGGTLYPTLNKDFPIVQQYASAVNLVWFPAHAINRMYLSPRSEIEREGWGMAPPEKIYMAMQMLARGDLYYANLLLDIPPAGLLDLADMSRDNALEWIQSFRTFVAGGGADGFKIPVLYEHTGKAEFIPLGQVPNDIMYDRITLKYAALIGAAYGMSLNDIGLQGTSSSGETLAGSIRQERRTRKTGQARIKKKLKLFFENMLPPTLQFDWVDLDDELATAKGRARLASATAFGQWIQSGVFDRKEARLQAIQDGLIDISIPEEPPSKPDPDFAPQGQERPGMLGNPQAPSQGGDGEVKKSVFQFDVQPSALNKAVESVVNIFSPSLQEILNVGEDEYEITRSMVLNSVFSDDEQEEMGQALKVLMSKIRFGNFKFDGLERELLSILDSEGLYAVNIESHVDALKSRIQQGFPEFVGRAIVYTLISSQFPETPEIQGRISESLEEYAYTFVSLEIQKTLEEIRSTSLELPQTLQVRSVIRNQSLPPNITVEAPQISLPNINVTVPERETRVFASTPDITVNVPEQKSEVTVNIPETVVNIENKLPDQPAPIVNMKSDVQAPVVNLQLPEQPAPIVNVDVNPPAVQIDNVVNVPEQKPVNKKLTIVKDGNVWTGEAETAPEE